MIKRSTLDVTLRRGHPGSADAAVQVILQDKETWIKDAEVLC